MEKLFGTDGVRGTANIYPMNADIALKLGMAAAKIFNLIADSDPNFLTRFSQLSEHGAYRKYIGKSQSDLYPDDPVRALNKSYEFRPGWWIPGGIGRRTLNKIIEMVCKVKDLEFGKDVYIIDN